MRWVLRGDSLRECLSDKSWFEIAHLFTPSTSRAKLGPNWSALGGARGELECLPFNLSKTPPEMLVFLPWQHPSIYFYSFSNWILMFFWLWRQYFWTPYLKYYSHKLHHILHIISQLTGSGLSSTHPHMHKIGMAHFAEGTLILKPPDELGLC